LRWSAKLTVKDALIFIREVKIIIYPNLISRFVFLLYLFDSKEAFALGIFF
tara:strand:+ start:241 stop:393 length:153 start_codon:yes stop_codon:yes gene_type:complete